MNSPNERDYPGYCILCSKRYESFSNMDKCEQCGTTEQPCKDKYQESIEVNHRELRLLLTAAEAWHLTNEEGADIVYAIAARIRRQLKYPMIPLTAHDEFQELKDKGIGFISNHPAADMP